MKRTEHEAKDIVSNIMDNITNDIINDIVCDMEACLDKQKQIILKMAREKLERIAKTEEDF